MACKSVLAQLAIQVFEQLGSRAQALQGVFGSVELFEHARFDFAQHRLVGSRQLGDGAA